MEIGDRGTKLPIRQTQKKMITNRLKGGQVRQRPLSVTTRQRREPRKGRHSLKHQSCHGKGRNMFWTG